MIGTQLRTLVIARLPLTLAALAAPALLGACAGTLESGTPVAADALCGEIAEVVCDTDERCWSSTHGDDCLEEQLADCEGTLQPLLDDPRLGYDELGAGRFLAQLRMDAATCWQSPVDYDALRGILGGTGAIGADCTPPSLGAAALQVSALSCESGSSCRLYLRSDGSTEGECSTRTDDACSHAYDCGGDQFCSLPASWQPGVWGSCRPLRANGWECASDGECQSRYCAGTCSARPEELRRLVAPYTDVVLADLPAAYLRLGETSGTRAVDETGSHNGTLVGTATHESEGAIEGDDDGSVQLTGTNAFVRVATIEELEGADGMSLECWFRQDDATAARPILEIAGEEHFGPHIWNFDSGDKLYANFIDSENAPHSVMSAEGVVMTGDWHHVVATYDGAAGRLYLDGRRIGDTAMTGDLFVDGELLIGHRNAYGEADARNFVGAIDEVAVYDHALSASRISRHHTAGVEGVIENRFPLFRWIAP
jgi:hypothetical protein